MSGQNYFLLTFLPGLGELGSAAPLEAKALVETARLADAPVYAVEIPVLEWDLRQREAFLAGEIETATGAVLSNEQMRNESPLPDYLETEGVSGYAAPADALWERYYQYAYETAEQHGSASLKAWVRYEVTLRNALVEQRAKTLGLDVTAHQVAAELIDSGVDVGATVNEWSSASTPLAGLQVLEQSRWRWLADNEQWFTFSNDELTIYTLKLLTLIRHNRLSQGQGAGAGGAVSVS